MPAKTDRGAARGLQPIGARLPRLGPSAAASASPTPRSPSSSSASAITGSPKPAGTPASSTGLRPSATGSGAPRTTAEALALLEAATPAAIEDNLRAWLPPAVTSAIASVWRSRPGPDPEIRDDPHIADYRLEGKPDPKAARDALALLELLDQRAEAGAYIRQIARLKVLTVAKNLTGEDLEMQVAAMTQEVAGYPIDVVRDACRAWAQGSKWFPSWAELRELCEDGVRFRRALMRELRAYLDGLGPEAEGDSDPPACTHWNARSAAIKAELGDAAWRVWLSQATPDQDDGKTLILAVPSRLIGHRIRGNYGPVLERILERKVMFVVKPWAGAAARARRARDDRDSAA